MPEELNLDQKITDLELPTETDLEIDDGGEDELDGVIERIKGDPDLDEETRRELALDKEDTETETEKPEEEILKEYGLPAKNLKELAEKYKELESSSSRRFDIFNWAAKNSPEAIQNFYQTVTAQMAKMRGVPGAEALGAAGNAGTEDKDFVERYGKDKLEEMKLIFKKLGFVHESELQRRDEASTTQRQKAAVADMVTEFGNNEDRQAQLEALGQDFHKDAVPAMDKILDRWGVKTYAQLTPEVLADAWNAYLFSLNGGMEKIVTRARESVRPKPKGTSPIRTGDSGPLGKGEMSLEDKFNSLSIEEQEKYIHKLLSKSGMK